MAHASQLMPSNVQLSLPRSATPGAGPRFDFTRIGKQDSSQTTFLRLRGGSDVAPAANFEEVGKAFVAHYYNIFDTNRANLQGLYQDVSMLTFE
eukprot:2502825-Rhodomonas_salina.1